MRTLAKYLLVLISCSLMLTSCTHLKSVKKSKGKTWEMCLLYISSDPVIIPILKMDSGFIKLIDYKVNRDIEEFEVIEISPVFVDYYFSASALEQRIKIQSALGTKFPPKRKYLEWYSKAYILVRKSDKKIKSKVQSSFEQGKVLAIDKSHVYMPNDSVRHLVSFRVHKYNKISDFDHLIRYE